MSYVLIAVWHCGQRDRGRSGQANARTVVGGTGTLNVVVRPWARIVVNGTLRGESTGVRGIQVPAGRYTITVSRPDLGGLARTERGQINAGESKTVRIMLQ